MKGRYCDALKSHSLGKMCLTKRILTPCTIGFGLAGFASCCRTETGLGPLLMTKVAKSLQGVVALKIGGVPASLLPELVRSVANTLSLLTFG